MSKYLSTCIFLILGIYATAQSEIKIGEWKSHLPYHRISHVETSEEKVYYATNESVLVVDKEDMSFDFLSTIEGLSEVGIQNMLYDKANHQLILAYDNSVIDIVSNDGIFKISDIKNQIDIQGDKSIYDMYIQNGQYLYLATGFGLIQFDLLSREFGFTLNISEPVFAVDGTGSDLIIATDTGVYKLDLTTTNAPGFFAEWTRQQSGLEDNYLPIDVMAYDNKFYVALDTAIYISVDGINYDLLYTETASDYFIKFLKQTTDGWMLGVRKTNNKSKLVFFNDADTQVSQLSDCTRRLKDAEMDDQGRIFLADDWEGIHFLESVSGVCDEYEVNSPEDVIASDLAVHDGTVYVASGGVSDNFGSLNNGYRGFYIYNDKEWTNYNNLTYDFMKGISRIYKTAVNSTGDKVYFGSFGEGLVEYNVETNEPTKLYDTENSSLQYQVGNAPQIRISALNFDAQDNLWIGNFSAEQPISILSADGQWQSFDIRTTDRKISDIVFDDTGLAWIVIRGLSSGVLVYDNNQTLFDTDDDEQRFITSNNSELPASEVLSVAVDNTGSVWVGTGEGAVVFECGAAATDDDCSGNKRKVLQDSIVGFLLETEEILSIAIDGADRKWFGTKNGIFVQSPNGEEQIAVYNEDNSPLFDNTINSMAFDANSGEMYIATNKGIQSLRTETTGATERHSLNVYAFPNPVTPEYSGPIAIKGLASDAEVHITDMNGRLVYKTDALGGQAIWEGKNLNGNNVPGGVYLVFSTTSDFSGNIDSYVTKIMMIR